MSKRLAATFRREARRGARASTLALTLSDLLQLHGKASAAVLLLLAALLSAAPIAGAGTVLAFVILALGWRWQREGEPPLLPRRLGGVALNAAWSRRCLRVLAWTYAVSSRWMRSRWCWLLHRRTHFWWGAWIALMGVLILLPVPMGNVLPGLSLVLFSLGWMFRDGLALLASTALGSGAIGYAVALGELALRYAGTALAWVQQFP